MKKNSRPAPLPSFKDKFEIPEQFFNSLSEFTNGAYILLYVNSFGEPEVASRMDSTILAMGMQKFGKDYFDSMEPTNNNVVIHVDSNDDSDDE